MEEKKSLNDIFGKRNKNIIEAFIKELSISTNEFSKWVNASPEFYDIVYELKKSLDNIRDLDDKFSQLKKYSNNLPIVKTIEIDLKENDIDVSVWEGNVKPVKVILSCLLQNDNVQRTLKECCDTKNFMERCLSLDFDFMIKDIVVLMEDGTFRTI